MFKTIFTVTKRTCGSIDSRVYFEDFKEAQKFAEKESKKLSGIVVLYGHKYPDGSLLYEWADKFHEITLDDFAWVTDFRVNGIGFYHNDGILLEFPNYDELQKYFLRSQEFS